MSLLAPVYNTLSRLYSALYPRAAKLDQLDESVSSRLASSDTRLANLNATIGSRLASDDTRLNNLNAAISSRAAAADYTAGRAANLDRIDTNIASRLSGSDARLNNLNDTISSRATQTSVNNTYDAVMARGNPADIWAYAGRSVIKSVQHGTMQALSTSLTATATITAVNTAKAFIVSSHSGENNVDFSDRFSLLRLSLSNSTTVTGTRMEASPGAEHPWHSAIYSFSVVEFM